MAKQSITYFPINKALCLPSEEEGDEEIELLAKQVEELESKLETISENLGGQLQGVAAGLEYLTVFVAKIAEGLNPESVPVVAAASTRAAVPTAVAVPPGASSGNQSPRKEPRKK